MSAILSVRNLYLHYSDPLGPVRAVDGVSFDLEAGGQALGLVGESGSGKSSLGAAILRMLPSNVARYEGEVMLDGRNLLTLADAELRSQFRWKKIALVPQGAMNGFNPVIRVGEQIIEPAIYDGAIDSRTARSRAHELLERVGLPSDIYNRYPHELSGGMKQRAMIAAALILHPPLVIMDEPTSALPTPALQDATAVFHGASILDPAREPVQTPATTHPVAQFAATWIV